MVRGRAESRLALSLFKYFSVIFLNEATGAGKIKVANHGCEENDSIKVNMN
jgi:hypothetical protein